MYMYILFSFILNHQLTFWRENVYSKVKQSLIAGIEKITIETNCLMVVKWLIGISKCAYVVLQYLFHMFPSLNLSPLCKINRLGTLSKHGFIFKNIFHTMTRICWHSYLLFSWNCIREMYVEITVIVYCIPNSFFFFQKRSPRTTSRITTNTDDTATAIVEVSEVSDIGVLAKRLVDVVILEL